MWQAHFNPSLSEDIHRLSIIVCSDFTIVFPHTFQTLCVYIEQQCHITRLAEYNPISVNTWTKNTSPNTQLDELGFFSQFNSDINRHCHPSKSLGTPYLAFKKLKTRIFFSVAMFLCNVSSHYRTRLLMLST